MLSLPMDGSALLTGRLWEEDVLGGTVTFLPLEEDADRSVRIQTSNVYQIRLSRSQQEWFMSVSIVCPEHWHADGVVHPTPTWLGEILLARLARWAVGNRPSGFKSTLSLVPIARYSQVYEELKEKYRPMVKVWPEVTDPAKFVFEDVAIATYLLVLWEQERARLGVTERQSFVDLGCGNGLLAHILCSQGHPGRGIDVRRRGIWAMFEAETRLEEGAITPDDRSLFPDADWLIGNHSDELTPWIPVIAARSSYRCRFFVLPCCFFGFVGKYPRRQSQKTQYREYLDFVTEVGQVCGFRVEEDCLRIPSTKRVCLIGASRTYPAAQEAAVDTQRTQYIHSQGGPRGPLQDHKPGPQHASAEPAAPEDPAPVSRDTQTTEAQSAAPEGLAMGAELEPVSRDTRATEAQPTAPEDPAAGAARGLWLPAFQPRERAERVRNCGTLPRDFVNQVVLQVAGLLLGRKHVCPEGASQDQSGKPWNPGGSLSLADVASELDRVTLQRLKRECGGLQTLLRNRHQVFAVRDGRVHLRDWREELSTRATRPGLRRVPDTDAFKTRPCWFFAHHPDGCALPAAHCPFAHGPGELRPAPTRTSRRAGQPPQPVPPESPNSWPEKS
ncbi:probable tRNA (uracil-O(2)-)-methyltransferase isoform X1 [Echinops telfairi]|uniref:Probable tRNA (Uracil-O(2)-)-methyltransferase isoform X1 n=1 Tax=Echinops telfairi TaxID=9371 RepID=A0AC55D148_ECHTE|nr:probable tRNA (uracil-O(2)-)-methyltransferase isoform X1 [Echinops telfairi]